MGCVLDCTGNVPNTVRGITDEERKSAAVKQIDRLNKLLAYFREVNGGTWNETAEPQLLTSLTTPMSRADILTVMKAARIYEVSETDGKKTKNYPSTDHSREDGLGYAATMFGNKVGPFFLNMNGITEIPTVDRWMLRAIGRLFGMTVQGRVNGDTRD